jgi:zinc transporter ZupT
LNPSDAGGLIALRLAAAVLSASLGALVAVSFKKISHLGLCLLISFAAGSLLAVTLLHLLPESLHIVGTVPGLASFASGYLLFFIITRFVSHVCPACSATHTEIEFRALTVAMIVALTVHSLMDGLAIYGGAMSGDSTGLLIVLAVAIHKFPEGMALSLIARESGMGRAKAFGIALGLEAVTTSLGAAAGSFLKFGDHEIWAGYVMGHVGGGFLFIVLHALWSEAVKHHPRWTILSALAGAGAVWGAQLLMAGHAH